MEIPTWTLEDITSRDAYEAILARVGGDELAARLAEQSAARRALEATLSPAQRDLFLSHSDAVSDAASLREAASARVVLCYGAGIGAALASFPEADPPALLETATGVVGAVLGSELSPSDAHGVAAAVLSTLARARVEPAPHGAPAGHRAAPAPRARPAGQEAASAAEATPTEGSEEE